MKFLASPNFDHRSDDRRIKYIMVHYTGMASSKESIERLCDPQSGVSAHYIIDEGGIITQMVDEKLRAWHAGVSKWHGEDDLNSSSIGIELSNLGHDLGYTDFTKRQMKSLEKLLSDLFIRHALPPSSLIAHSDVAPTRKQDPGEKFPWKHFADLGFGLWPQGNKTSDEDLTTLLTKAGYDCTNEKAAITAFQRHYCVEELGTNDTTETIKKLTAFIGSSN